MIEISQTAAQEIARIQFARQKPHSTLRLKVEQGGCCGLFYCLNLELPQGSNQQTFQKEPQQDLYFESNGVSIVVDSQSYLSLKGTKLDYAEDLMGGGFRWQNPNTLNTCSCGISFTLKNTNSN